MVVYRRNQQPQNTSEQCSPYDSYGVSVGFGDSPLKSNAYSRQVYSEFDGLPSTYHDKKKSIQKSFLKSLSRATKNLGVLNCVQLSVILILVLFNHQKNTKLKLTSNELREINADLMETMDHLDEFEHDLDVAHTELKRMHKIMLAHHSDHDHDDEHYWLHHEEAVDISNDVIAKHDAQEERIIELQKRIQDIHRNELERR
jgi:hypothetical protein